MRIQQHPMINNNVKNKEIVLLFYIKLNYKANTPKKKYKMLLHFQGKIPVVQRSNIMGK